MNRRHGLATRAAGGKGSGAIRGLRLVILFGLMLRACPALGADSDWQRIGPAAGEAGGEGYRLRGAVGQAEAGTAGGGGYRWIGGFWNPVALGPLSTAPPRIEGVTLVPDSGTSGSVVHAQGRVSPAGASDLNVYWEDAGTLRLIARGRASAGGTFDLPLVVPADAKPGAVRVALHPGGAVEGSPAGLAFAPFQVILPQPGRIGGIVRNEAGQGTGAGVRVRLAAPDGFSVAETFTDGAGGFFFANIPPESYQVQVMTGGYAPKTVLLVPGKDFEVTIDPAGANVGPLPPVMLLSAGAVALPGGSLAGNSPVQVGDWTDTPMARLVSLQGQSLKPLQVRFWAEVQRVTLAPNLPLVVGFQLRKGGQPVGPAALVNVPGTVYPEGKLKFPAFTADFNSLELPPGKLTLSIVALTAFVVPLPVGQWEFPVEVLDLGSRWYSGNVKNPSLKVTKRDFLTLRYDFTGSLPSLPGVGTPLFSESFDLKVVTVDNFFDLGVELHEWMENQGAWDGSATAKAGLTLFDVPIIDQSRAFYRQGNSLRSAVYQLDPLTVPLLEEVCFPIVGPALPKPIDLCGLKFGGSVGVKACFGGKVTLLSDIESDLHLNATVAPEFEVTVPIGADLELGPCKATAEVRPSLAISAPIELDPKDDPPVHWNGLCIQFSGNATAALGCCGLELDKSVDLFDPVEIGTCPKPAGTVTRHGAQGSLMGAPPRRASLAYSPTGQAAAVWENFEQTPEGWVRTAPVVSLFDGVNWSPPWAIAGPEYAGWEPKIAFVDPENVVVTWVVPNLAQRSGVQPQGIGPHGLCDIAGKIVDLGCDAIKTAATVVKVICLGFCGSPAIDPSTSGPADLDEAVVVLGGGLLWNMRPVLATHPTSGDAIVVWLREQEPIPGVQQSLALYFSRRGAEGWSAPERVDPASNSLDLQPSVRFDRHGMAAVVWVRDLDGNLETVTDRTLVFSRLEGVWTPPEVLAPLPPAPWTPSLEFDRDNQPVVAFVVPTTDPRSGDLLPADGTLSTLHVARRVGGTWKAGAIGESLRMEAPVVRVTADNHALILGRAFGGRFGRAGNVASAIASLDAVEPRWSVAPMTAGETMNWHVAAELNPASGEVLAVWERRRPADALVEPELVSLPRAWLPDLALAEPALSFSAARPTPGVAVDITARVTNRGWKPLRGATFRVDFYDGDPALGVTPFASQTVSDSLDFDGEQAVTVRYMPADRAWRRFHVVVDTAGQVSEADESNNVAVAAWGGLAAPGDFSATPNETDGSIRLRWSSPLPEGGAQSWIWRTRLSTGETELLGGTNGEEFLDRAPGAGQNYSYTVVTSDADGVESTTRLPVPVTVPVPAPPDAGSLRLNSVSYAGAVTLTWNALPAVQLQAADELSGEAAAWRPVIEGVMTFGGVGQISLPAMQGQRFFRLIQP